MAIAIMFSSQVFDQYFLKYVGIETLFPVILIEKWICDKDKANLHALGAVLEILIIFCCCCEGTRIKLCVELQSVVLGKCKNVC